MTDSLLWAIEKALVVLVAVHLFWEYRSYRIDQLRQDLFRVRDELFRAAERGEIAFDAPAYGITRATLNGMIRYAHELTLVRAVIAVVSSRTYLAPPHTAYRSRIAVALKALPSDQQRKLILEAQRQMNLNVGKHLFLTSPLAMVAMLIATLLLVVDRLLGGFFRADKVSGRAKRAIGAAVDNEAFELGTEFGAGHC